MKYLADTLIKLLASILIVIILSVLTFILISDQQKSNVLRLVARTIINDKNFQIQNLSIDTKKKILSLYDTSFKIGDGKIMLPAIDIKYASWDQEIDISFKKVLIDDKSIDLNFLLKSPNFWSIKHQWSLFASNEESKCSIDSQNSTIKISQCYFKYDTTYLNISGNIVKNQKIEISSDFDNLPLDSYKFIKPFAKSHKVSEFFDYYVQEGNISGSLNINLDLNQQELKEENLSGHINLTNGVFKYDPDFPTVEKINAEVTIKGREVKSKISNAHSGGADAKGGSIYFAWQGEKDSKIIIDVDIKAHAKDINNFLLPENKKQLKKQGIDFTTSLGSIDAKINVTVPLREGTENSWQIDGNINNFSLGIAKEKIMLSKADLKVSLDDKHLSSTGYGNINGYYTKIKYEQDIPYTHSKIDCDLDLTKTDDQNGMLMASGEAILKIHFEDLNDKKNITVTSDLTKAKIILNQKSVETRIGEKLTLNASSSDNLDTLDIKLTGSGPLALTGKYNFEKDTLSNIVFNSKYIKNFTGFSQFLKDKIVINGQVHTFDMSEQDLMGATAVSRSALSLDVKINNLILKNDLTLNNCAIMMQCNKDRCTQSNIVASVGEQNVEAKLVSSTGEEQEWVVSTSNAGALLKALGLYKNVNKGNMSLNISMKKPPKDSNNNAPLMKGNVTIKNFYALKTPILTKIVSLTSIPGLVNLITADIKFQKLDATFNVLNNVINVLDCNVAGSSFDFMAKGAIDMNKRKIILKGAVVPSLYGLNSLIKVVPIINTLLNRKKVKGIIIAPFSIEETY
ncbi:hypothetical protein phytr_6230 [Candidatus Phycorickettsia trachydisci]|uniref:YhdP central domain-containing protein n=1 Tax=Candidatus Phycorickettsia trachydisci TaxID=2115978 RepID=A0A2P1P8H8_9RICK|nr:DUF3971 domain-containing protein [Candidatus Phycorickettsia trachydisci]AVP87564.1 hypothetical protein phytr_6230 [Candidatus Phycorickettsia trachydisci]